MHLAITHALEIGDVPEIVQELINKTLSSRAGYDCSADRPTTNELVDRIDSI